MNLLIMSQTTCLTCACKFTVLYPDKDKGILASLLHTAWHKAWRSFAALNVAKSADDPR